MSSHSTYLSLDKEEESPHPEEIPYKKPNQTSLLHIKETVYDFFLSFKSIYPVFILNFFFFLFTNLLNTSIISSINYTYQNNNDIIEAIGFTNTMLNVTIYPLYIGFCSIFAILGSQAYGANKIKLMKYILNQTRVFGIILSLIISLLYLLAYSKIVNLFGLSIQISEYGYDYTLYRLYAYFFEFEIFLLLTYLQIIEKGMVGVYIVVLVIPFVQVVSSKSIDYYSVNEPNVNGAGVGFLLNILILFIVIQIYNIFFLGEVSHSLLDKDKDKDKENTLSYKKNDDDEKDVLFQSSYSKNTSLSLSFSKFLIQKSKSKAKDLVSFLKSYKIYFKSVNIIYISFLDLLSFEMISYLAIFTSNKEYSSYVIVNSIYGVLQCINYAYSSSACVNIGYFIGKGNVKKGRSYFYYLLIQSNFIIFTACLLIYIYKPMILDYVAERGELWDYSNDLLVYALVINIQDACFIILFSTLKSLNENKLALYITFTYNIFNFLSMYFFSFYLQHGVYGLYYGFIVSDCLVIVYLFYMFLYKIDWQRQIKKSNEEMKESEELIKELEMSIS